MTISTKADPASSSPGEKVPVKPLKKILLIAYHFPPQAGSSGYLRTLKFAEYLPEFGYEPVVLTISTGAYERTDDRLLTGMPASLQVFRAFGLDAKKSFSIKGRYFDFMTRPDRYSTWIPFAVRKGLHLMQKLDIDLFLSTFPVASAHLVGYWLQNFSGKKWIADFRDPMWEEGWSFRGRQLAARKKIERLVARNADQLVVATPGNRDLFTNRYNLEEDRIKVIYNGFDEKDFKNLELAEKNDPNTIRLLHMGLLEKNDRNPVPFFEAVKRYKDSDKANSRPIIVDFYAPTNEAEYQGEIDRLGIADLVKIRDRISYADALKEMARSHILLLFQGAICNNQIPAKLYEYLRIGKPILALTPDNSDTASIIRKTGVGATVPLDDPLLIAEKLTDWIDRLVNGEKITELKKDKIQQFSRYRQTKELATYVEQTFEQVY